MVPIPYSTYFGYRPGVLNRAQIKELSEHDIIRNLNPEEVDESSFDLHLGNRYWEMQGSVKPLGDEYINDIAKYGTEKEIENSVVLETGKIYIFQTQEDINFSGRGFFAKATGRSSIGRLDVLTRLIAPSSKHDTYDEVKKGYAGNLFLEVIPITFSIKVTSGTPISQLRVFLGNPEISEIKELELEFYLSEHILRSNGSPENPQEFRKLRLNLEPDRTVGENVVAFKAKTVDERNDEQTEPIDLSKDISKETNKYDPGLYWGKEEVRIMGTEKYVEIEKDRFYILRSKERFNLPEDVAIYCRAVTEELGEIRIHYAGFVHPLFGSSNVDEYGSPKGAPLIFEVRGHNVNTVLRDGETLANLIFYKMSRDGEKDSNEYGKQELKLSKYFKEDWPVD